MSARVPFATTLAMRGTSRSIGMSLHLLMHHGVALLVKIIHYLSSGGAYAYDAIDYCIGFMAAFASSLDKICLTSCFKIFCPELIGDRS